MQDFLFRMPRQIFDHSRFPGHRHFALQSKTFETPSKLSMTTFRVCNMEYLVITDGISQIDAIDIF